MITSKWLFSTRVVPKIGEFVKMYEFGVYVGSYCQQHEIEPVLCPHPTIVKLVKFKENESK